jgi:hypothetical protein
MNRNPFHTQEKIQTTHYNHKQNETNEATVLAIITFIGLIIFVAQA